MSAEIAGLNQRIDSLTEGLNRMTVTLEIVAHTLELHEGNFQELGTILAGLRKIITDLDKRLTRAGE